MQTLSLADFFSGLAITETMARLDINSTSDMAAKGVTRATYGTRVWVGTVSIAPSYHADADKLAAKLQYLQEADILFRLTPGHLAGKVRTAGTIREISASDRRIVTLSAQLDDGAMFDVEFAGKRSMHRVVRKLRDRSSLGAGSAEYTVVPPMPFGAAATNVIGMGRPEIVAAITDASLATYQAAIAGSASFEWAQVL